MHTGAVIGWDIRVKAMYFPQLENAALAAGAVPTTRAPGGSVCLARCSLTRCRLAAEGETLDEHAEQQQAKIREPANTGAQSESSHDHGSAGQR